MADTSQHELSEPHTNGAVDGLTEEEKSKMRPADIDADMREMERRKRVEMMMNSRLFREELERIIETQMKDGGAGPSGLLQQISDMMGAQGARFNSNVFKSSNCVVPINDIRGVESMGYAKGEKLLRCKLAAVFRLLDLYGWTQGVGGHITARLNQDQEHFLVNPYGLLYHEVTASSLVKVDMQGSVVEQGTTNFGVHVTGFQLHSTIHAARPDIKCIIHITTPSVIAVSSLKCGLLPLGQESIVIGEASTHQYIGGVFEPEEKEKISRNLGPVNKIMFLTNRGALCCGETVEEAFYNVYNTVLACETQLKLIPAGIDNLNLVSEESRKAIFDASRKPPVPQQASVAEPSPLADKLEKRWRIGGTEFEALMRMLDNAGFRTGYIYRHPLVKGEPPRPRNDVEVPPAVSSLGYLLEEEELYKQGLWKGGRKGTDRSRWLNSPNVYQKVEILETGTPDPKKITKWVDQNAEEWVTDGSPTHSSTPVKIESALQFVPKNTNPKEFKQLQQQIKDYRRADKISAGPQSHILEGVSWDEAKKMQDATISATGEQVVLVGAASKGIIQRGFQHNAMVYKTPYAKNPFDAVTDQELDQYKKDVERKQKGDPYDESQSESEGLSSFNVSRATHESSTAKSPIQSPVSVTSETEEESRDEPRVLRIETKQVPLPSQPEVVLSDESTATGVVVESPLVQQAIIQQAQRQSQTIIQQKPPVDATTEFLNEMRRTAIVDPRNDLNRRDCQSSNSGSISGGNSYGWPTEPYETIRLEVTRSSTIAPRMTPLITEIVHSNLSNNKLEPTNVKIKRPPPVPPKPKPYIALRNAFLNNFPATKPAQVSNFPYADCHLNSNSNSNSTLIPTNQTEILDYTVDKTQVAGVSELFNVSVEQIESVNFSICVNDEELDEKPFDNLDSESKFTRNVADSVCNEETGDDIDMGKFSCILNTGANIKEAVSVSTNILKESNSSKGNRNDCETIFRKVNDTSPHKPLIVGAILKNINDLHTLCLGSDVKSDIAASEVSPEENSKEFEQNLDNQSDENGNYSPVSNKISQDNKSTEANLNLGLNNSFDATLICINDNDSTTANVSEEKLKLQSLDVETGILAERTINDRVARDLRDKDAVNNNAVQPAFAQDEVAERNEYLDNENLMEFTTPPRASNFLRLDSLTEVMNSVKVNLTPTKMLLSALPESNISSKYNLDPTNMSLIYSLTPTNDDIDADRRLSRNTSVDLSDESFSNAEFKRLNSRNTDDSVHDEETEYIWIDLVNANKKNIKENFGSNQTIDLFDSSMESLDGEDNVSNQGSDILELPHSTVQELRETDGESFNRDMKIIANQIIAELGDIEVYTHASNFVDEILYDISCLKLDENNRECNVSAVVQDKLNALVIAKDVANTLISDLPCYETKLITSIQQNNDSLLSKSKNYFNDVIVIDEIVHHVVDKFNSTKTSLSSSSDSYNLKKVKESTNTELKEMRNSFKVQNDDVLCLNDQDITILEVNNSPETISMHENIDAEVIPIIDIDKELNLIQEIEIEECQSSQTFVQKSFNSDAQENVREMSPEHFHSSDERVFITLGSFPSSNHGSAMRSVSNESLNDCNNEEYQPSELEEINNHNEHYSSCKTSCQFPLDCSECSFIRFKKYRSIDNDDDEEDSYTDYAAEKLSEENTESDITDNDTLGEAILVFCAMGKPSSTKDRVELNFCIERDEKKDETEFFDSKVIDLNKNSEMSEKKEEASSIDRVNRDKLYGRKFEIDKLAECTQCRCCAVVTSLDFMTPGQLSSISEETNESIDNSSRIKSEEESFSVSHESSLSTDNNDIQFDYLDSLSDSEVLIAEWFDDYITSSSNIDKLRRTSLDQSVVSLESVNTVDYHSCRDDSHSTVFQSIQNTAESNELNVEKNDQSDIEIIYVADKTDSKHDGTYTLSDTSLNSLDTISSIESDKQERSQNPIDASYNADISTNIDDIVRRSTNSIDRVSSSSSSADVRLSNHANCFDTTMNMADMSSDFLSSKYQRVECSNDENDLEINDQDETALECLSFKNEALDSMTYSYDTREFIRLEEELAQVDTQIFNSTYLENEKCEKFCNEQNLDSNGLSPIDPPPKYEDTTLYRVVSQINLTDIINQVSQ